MPYIKQVLRKEFQHELEKLMDDIEHMDESAKCGALNYVISNLCAPLLKPLSYNNLNRVIGVLECVKLELYRRCAHYEDKKIAENGDIVTYEDVV